MATPTPKTDGRETRTFTKGLELRFASGDGGSKTTKGYACLFDNVTSIGGYWQERFAKGAFTNSLGDRDVVALHSHDDGRPMGRMSRDTLRIKEDDKGLAFENDLPDTQDGRDLATSIDRGDIEGMSFRFRALKEEWDETQDPPMRTIIEAELYEITYTAFPAYPDTEVGMRSLEHARQERRQHNQAGAIGRIAARRMKLAQRDRRI
ncbi:HK97 family phage prohead protease [Pelagerythrobacter marensis]|uniref:HK97 family phage prohead protease n=1 Tax=Pelagerythrobacter marensis TaxID=543877 RepID=A0ABZ2D9L2_9SPHN